MNQVIRECNKCCYSADADEFGYRGDDVWSCPNCQSMWTHIKAVIDLYKVEDGTNE